MIVETIAYYLHENDRLVMNAEQYSEFYSIDACEHRIFIT